MCVRGNIRVCVCSHMHVCVHVCHQTQSESKRTQGVDKKVNQTSEIKTGNIIPEKGGKLISSVTTNQIEEPIRGYSIRAFEAIATDLLGIAPDRCAV